MLDLAAADLRQQGERAARAEGETAELRATLEATKANLERVEAALAALQQRGWRRWFGLP